MRVVITGSRHFANKQQIIDWLRAEFEKNPHLEIAHGNSRGGGVDAFVRDACGDLGIPQWPFPVRPIDGRHRGAPLNRNERMVRSFMPDRVVAFRAPGKSNGTDHTISFAQRMGIPTETIEEASL